MGQAIGFCRLPFWPIAQSHRMSTGKRDILAEIKRIADASGGKPPACARLSARLGEGAVSLRDNDADLAVFFALRVSREEG